MSIAQHPLLREVLKVFAGDALLRRWLHKVRRSTYIELGRGRIQTTKPLNDGDAVVLYQSEDNGTLWARRLEDFDDGRYEQIT